MCRLDVLRWPSNVIVTDYWLSEVLTLRAGKGQPYGVMAWSVCLSIGGLLIASGFAVCMWLPGFFRVWGSCDMARVAGF